MAGLGHEAGGYRNPGTPRATLGSLVVELTPGLIVFRVWIHRSSVSLLVGGVSCRHGWLLVLKYPKADPGLLVSVANF